MTVNTMTTRALAAVFGAVIATSAVQAGPLEDRIGAGEPIRLGFSNAPPWAYPDENGAPKGFVNGIAIDVLERMGHSNVEPVLTDWSGLIPSLMAERVDMVTGGMYILQARCENMDFSDPIGAFGDTFLVPEGNPKGIQTYQDLIDKDLVMVASAGYNTIADAKSAGVPESNIMSVPSGTEVLAALRAGRADAAPINVLEAKDAVNKMDGIEMTDPDAFVGRKKQVVGIGFHPEDDAFREEFNKVLADYLGSDEMMATVTPDNYIKAFLPGDASTEEACNAD